MWRCGRMLTPQFGAVRRLECRRVAVAVRRDPKGGDRAEHRSSTVEGAARGQLGWREPPSPLPSLQRACSRALASSVAARPQRLETQQPSCKFLACRWSAANIVSPPISRQAFNSRFDGFCHAGTNIRKKTFPTCRRQGLPAFWLAPEFSAATSIGRPSARGLSDPAGQAFRQLMAL